MLSQGANRNRPVLGRTRPTTATPRAQIITHTMRTLHARLEETWDLVLKMIVEHDGDNDYKLPHHREHKIERQPMGQGDFFHCQ